jgi:Mpv17 / PMP22 family
MGLMEGRDKVHIRAKFNDIYSTAVFANWKVWPLAQVSALSTCSFAIIEQVQLINFRFMPLPYRVPFQSTCGVFWTLYLSILNSEYVSIRQTLLFSSNLPFVVRTQNKIVLTPCMEQLVDRINPNFILYHGLNSWTCCNPS